MKKSIYLSICISIYISIYISISLSGQVINSQEIEKGISIQRNTLFNLEELKVRWKKAALENCPGIPCIVTPPPPPPPSFTCGTSTVTDIDLNSYSTVSIGAQCWTKTNLKVTKYNDGTLIPDLTTSTSNPWAPASGARTEYVAAGVTGYVGTFGYLYNWYAVTDIRKLCPTGYHVPTDAEWTTLTTHLGGLTVAGGKMKETGTSLWNTPNAGADNTSVFTGLPGGYRNNDGSFDDISYSAFFWSATEIATNNAWGRYLNSSNGSVSRASSSKSVGASVRCLRD